MTISNHAHHDAMIRVASTVGTNMKTLRANKRALACGMILASAVEGFKWKDVWEAARKACKFAQMEKDEQNQMNVMQSACKLVAENWDTLDKDQREAITNLTATTSTMAKAIKDAEKAKIAAEKEEADKAAAGAEASSHADADIDGTTTTTGEDGPVAKSPNVFALDTVIALLGQDTFAADETPKLVELLAAVDALRERIAEAARAAA